MATPRDYHRKGLRRIRGHPLRRRKRTGDTENATLRAEGTLRGPGPHSARTEASSSDAILENNYRQLARQYWLDLPRTLLTRSKKLRVRVEWVTKALEPACAVELRIPIVIENIFVGYASVQRKRKRTKKLPRSQFAPVATLLRLFVRHVEIATSLELRSTALAKARQRAAEHEHEEMKLRAALSRRLPGLLGRPAGVEERSHVEKLVQRMLDYVQNEYMRPITLKECARQMEFNAAYLCALFSRTVGIPFKSYLTRLRLEKARYLLSDPTRRVSEVAYAVGYTNASRFRLAFKAATSLTPVRWRDTLRTQPAR